MTGQHHIARIQCQTGETDEDHAEDGNPDECDAGAVVATTRGLLPAVNLSEAKDVAGLARYFEIPRHDTSPIHVWTTKDLRSLPAAHPPRMEWRPPRFSAARSPRCSNRRLRRRLMLLQQPLRPSRPA